ncbi:MAG: carboxy terminal-processing peptidase [Chromatiales bacterium]|nr:carboxy terminal-processing peptidase [Chromatiales bacterium]
MTQIRRPLTMLKHSLGRLIATLPLLALLLAWPPLAEPRAEPAAVPAVLETTPRHRQAARLVTRFVEQYHYARTPVDDNLSEAVLRTYIEFLDPNRHNFLQSDIAYFDRYRNRLDNVLKSGDMEPVFDIFRLYRLRVQQNLSHALALLEEEPDFTVDEDYEFNRENQPWLETPAEMQDLWRRRVKHDLLGLMLAERSFEDAADVLRRRYQRVLDRTNDLDSDAVVENFLNAFARTLDPHSGYLSPRQSEEYRIQMSLSYQGVGASLQLNDDLVTVLNIIPGGPADIDGRIKANDRITAVGQGEDGEMVDVVGWQLDDVVQLIRGRQGTVVRLQILPADALPGSQERVVDLVRDKIKLEEQAARSQVVPVDRDGEITRIGVITIPSFYQDFDARSRGDREFVSTTRDVARLIRELEAENIEGLVLDLRGNGGGHLTEATSLTALFIDSGPVVQIRDTNGRVEILEDAASRAAYTGPLVVMVDRFSASASEIFAAAIQDYRRGVVIGQQTFGKGTVQNLLSLDNFAPRNVPEPGLGQLTLTVAKFYRVTGESTQSRGVVPDIILPSAVDPDLVGESSRERALPWDKIASTRYEAREPLDMAIDLLTRHKQEQLQTDPDLLHLQEDIRAAAEIRARRTVSLNLEQRIAEREAQQTERLARENRRRQALGMELLEILGDEDGDSARTERPDVLLQTAASLASELWRVKNGGGAEALARHGDLKTAD